jgi:hypothetical protein
MKYKYKVTLTKTATVEFDDDRKPMLPEILREADQAGEVVDWDVKETK